MYIQNVSLREKFKELLKEDFGRGDITSESVVPLGTKVQAQIIVKMSAVIAGLYETKIFFEMFNIDFQSLAQDGAKVEKGKVIAKLYGEARTILTLERTILNILMRMCAIATTTHHLIKKVKAAGYKVKISATRKTVPGLRYFDKKAVIVAGGDTHRLGLDDMVLIKDNHITIAKGIKNAVKKVRENLSFTKKIEVEAKTYNEAIEAAKEGVDIIMLDNMKPNQILKVIKGLKKIKLRDKMIIELSGEINQNNILDYAKCKPDIISLGYITHSIKAIDISLKIKINE